MATTLLTIPERVLCFKAGTRLTPTLIKRLLRLEDYVQQWTSTFSFLGDFHTSERVSNDFGRYLKQILDDLVVRLTKHLTSGQLAAYLRISAEFRELQSSRSHGLLLRINKELRGCIQEIASQRQSGRPRHLQLVIKEQARFLSLRHIVQAAEAVLEDELHKWRTSCAPSVSNVLNQAGQLFCGSNSY